MFQARWVGNEKLQQQQTSPKFTKVLFPGSVYPMCTVHVFARQPLFGPTHLQFVQGPLLSLPRYGAPKKSGLLLGVLRGDGPRRRPRVDPTALRKSENCIL